VGPYCTRALISIKSPNHPLNTYPKSVKAYIQNDFNW
jgi:hypothetical protein